MVGSVPLGLYIHNPRVHPNPATHVSYYPTDPGQAGPGKDEASSILWLYRCTLDLVSIHIKFICSLLWNFASFRPGQAGPGKDEPSSKLWLYRSTLDVVGHANAGLVGPIIVTRKDSATADARPTDVDRELITLFQVCMCSVGLHAVGGGEGEEGERRGEGGGDRETQRGREGGEGEWREGAGKEESGTERGTERDVDHALSNLF